MPSGSFFEKLKRGMGIENEEEIKEEEVEEPKPKKKKIRINSRQKTKAEPKVEKKTTISQSVIKEEPVQEEKEEEEIKETPELSVSPQEKWFETEGELAIDVYQTDADLVIQSAIAGVKPEDLDITLERDIITVKGSREKPYEETGDYFTQECFWGPFSREVILPVEVDPDRTEAAMKDGILTIRLPKILREKKRKIKIRM